MDRAAHCESELRKYKAQVEQQLEALARAWVWTNTPDPQITELLAILRGADANHAVTVALDLMETK